jgi:tetratricopeptide (TPR) repeat protein
MPPPRSDHVRPAGRRAILLAAASFFCAAATGCDGDRGDGGAAPPAGAAPAGEEAAADAVAPLTGELADFANLIKDGQLGAARVRLRKHLDRHPGDGRAEFLFGLSYHREKRYGQARPYFEAAIDHAPDYPLTHYFLGWALYYLGEPAAARREFESHLRAHPESDDTHFGLGLVALEEDRLDDAEHSFRTALDLFMKNPDDVRGVSKARTRLADVHMARGEWEQARTELEIATRLYPDHYEAFYKLSRVLHRLGETEAAEEAQRQSAASRQRLYPGTRFPE